MPGFDIKTAIPIADDNGVATKEPEFDINTALKMTEPVSGEDGYDAFVRSQFHQQIKDNINRPLSAGEVRFIQDTEAKDPGALQSFLIPYTEGVVGFFTKPFGYRPDLSRPFGLEKGPKPQTEVEQDIAMQKEHPVAFTLGQIVSGVAPFIVTAPLFPQSLLGTLATFETVGLTRKVGEIRTDESLLMPPGEKAWELGKEAVKEGAMAPIWYYSGALKFIGRPYLSALARAGVRGTGTVGLEAVFGTDLGQALKQGGMITALSLIFEAPMLAKTALGRGIIAQANRIASEKGLPEGKYTIDVDKLDAISTRSSLFNLIKGFYTLMRTKIERPAGAPVDPAKQITYDKLTYTPETASPEPPEAQGGTIWALKGVGTPPPAGPKAGGIAHLPEKAPVFYSKLASSLAEKMPESAPADQVRGILKSSGVPKEEIEWSGIEDFLKGKAKVSKIELLDYLSKNQVAIEEVWKGVEKPKEEFDIVEADRATEAFDEGKQIHGVTDAGDIESIEDKSDLDRYNRFIIRNPPAENISKLGTNTKYSEHQLPGGENYKEVLFRIPATGPVKKEQFDVKQISPHEFVVEKNLPGDQPDTEIGPIHETEQEARDYLAKLEANPGNYRSSHWDESNVFAHARLTDRTTKDGKKILFIEEIQSDWAKEARKYGELTETEQKRYDELKKIPPHKRQPEESDELDALITKVDKGVPSHPLLKHWMPIVLKRLLRYAAENGYDGIAWTTGEQQTDRYDLSKQVDSINYHKNSDGTYSVDIWKNGKLIEGKSSLSAQDLQRYIGKDISKKVLANEGKKIKKNIDGFVLKGEWREISGQNVKIGGEWASNLYDEQIPNILKDLTKKEAGSVDLSQEIPMTKIGKLTPDELATYKKGGKLIQPYFEFTPELKQSLVYQGQPLLGKTPKDIGIPGKEFEGMKIFRMDEEMQIVNTKGEIVTLPKGEEYRTLPVYDSEGNLVPNKIKLQDGKQITVYEGELNKLKGKILGEGEQPMAGGMIHPLAPEEGQPPEEKSKPRVEQRKSDMELWNTPDIVGKLNLSEREFLKRYIDEKKSLKEIAKELGEDIEKKTEMPDEVREKISFARKYFKRGQYTMAIGEYETALENNPEVAILYINLAEVQKKMGEFDNAIGSYLKYLDVKPDDINVHFELGLLYKIKGDRNMAVKYFSRCKELEPDSSLARRSQKHINELL